MNRDIVVYYKNVTDMWPDWSVWSPFQKCSTVKNF